VTLPPAASRTRVHSHHRLPSSAVVRFTLTRWRDATFTTIETVFLRSHSGLCPMCAA